MRRHGCRLGSMHCGPVPRAGEHWNLDLFEERLDLRIKQENPAQDLVIIVLDWI
jgi:hypothetical protein